MSYFEHLPAVRYEGPRVRQSFCLPSLRSRQAGTRQAHGRSLAAGRLLLAHIRMARRGHVRAGNLSPAVAATRRRHRTSPRESRLGVRILLETGRAVLHLPRHGRRARRRQHQALRRTTSKASRTIWRPSRKKRASSCCGARRTCSRIRVTQRAPRPIRTPKCLRSRPPRCSRRLRPRIGLAVKTMCCGAAAKVTTRC